MTTKSFDVREFVKNDDNRYEICEALAAEISYIAARTYLHTKVYEEMVDDLNHLSTDCLVDLAEKILIRG